MIPSLTTEQLAFQEAVREFFAEPWAREERARLAGAARGVNPDMEPVHRRLGERGWLAVSWPPEYGGQGRTAVEAAILHRELVRHGFPDLGYVVSICYVGNFLLLAANETLKRRYLPRLASGELSSCTLYSEPGVGSDLGSLAATAELVDGSYRIHGTKVHSQATEYAEYGLVAARTAAGGRVRHDGITLFWVPLRAPGVSVRTVPNITDQPFSEVTFDGVLVPADHVVGPPHQGWPLLNAALSIERTGFEAHLKMRSWLDSVVARAGETGALDDPLVADAVVKLDAQVEAGGVLAWSMIHKQADERFDAAASAMSKWFNTELARPIARLALDLDGLGGALSRWDTGAPAGGRAEAAYRESPGLTLSAGTSEIMLYAVAAGLLRLDDEDAPADRLDDVHEPFRRRLGRFLRSRVVPDWPALAKSNVVRLTLPAEVGGLALGVTDSVVAAEEMGKVLLPGPYVGAVSVADVVALGGPGSALWPWLRGFARGEHTIALTSELDEAGATLSAGQLNGTVAFVPYADGVDSLAVMASTPSGPTLVLVARDQAGVTVHRHDELGHGDLFRVEFRRTALDPDRVVCGHDSPLFEELLARVHMRQSGYLLGLAQAAFDLTLAYTRKRRQFGQPVARFQHLSFRLAALAARLHAARELLYHQTSGHDLAQPAGSRTATTLAMVAELARDVTADAIQFHGAVGMTETAEIQRYYRQAAVHSVLFGTPTRLRATAVGRLRKEVG